MEHPDRALTFDNDVHISTLLTPSLSQMNKIYNFQLIYFRFILTLFYLLLYSLPNIVRVVKSRRMRWAGHMARMGEDRGVHRVLVGKPEGKRALARPRRRWEDNIKMDL
jgi:hypothetical protein